MLSDRADKLCHTRSVAYSVALVAPGVNPTGAHRSPTGGAEVSAGSTLPCKLPPPCSSCSNVKIFTENSEIRSLLYVNFHGK